MRLPLLLCIAAAFVTAQTEDDPNELPDGGDSKEFHGAAPVRLDSLRTDEPTEADAEVALTEGTEGESEGWKDYPLTERYIQIDKDCDCQVKWMKKVYNIPTPPCHKKLPRLLPNHDSHSHEHRLAVKLALATTGHHYGRTRHSDSHSKDNSHSHEIHNVHVTKTDESHELNQHLAAAHEIAQHQELDHHDLDHHALTELDHHELAKAAELDHHLEHGDLHDLNAIPHPALKTTPGHPHFSLHLPAHSAPHVVEKHEEIHKKADDDDEDGKKERKKRHHHHHKHHHKHGGDDDDDKKEDKEEKKSKKHHHKHHHHH